jgi:hypothetical protein
MEKNGQPLEPSDLRFFDENQRRIPPELLFAHAGQHVAWSPDGSRILACGKTRKEVYQKLEAAGIAFSQVVHDYIDDPDLGVI